MSSPSPRTMRPQSVADWLKPHLQWITLPSWLVSCLFHAAVVVVWLFVANSPGCQGDYMGEEGVSFEAVGIVIEDSTSNASDPEPTGEESPQADSMTMLPPILESTAAPPAIPDAPPIDISLPSIDAPPVIGIGGPPRSVAAPGELLKPMRSGAPAAVAAPGSGRGATSLFGIQDAGKRFVYVIDTSSSMDRYGALKVAKIKLMASLENLDESQQFQVLFVNSSGITQLDPTARGQRAFSDLFSGTDSHRLSVRMQMSSISPDSGTEHYKGLLAALELRPDVIFYLTDAGEPGLAPGEMADLRALNRHGTHIHCIEFGEGPAPRTPSGDPAPGFLTKLAKDHSGRYTYQNVREFTR